MAVPSLHKDHLPVSRISQESRFPKIAKPTPLCRAGSGESGHKARPERGLLPERQGLPLQSLRTRVSAVSPDPEAAGKVRSQPGEKVVPKATGLRATSRRRQGLQGLREGPRQGIPTPSQRNHRLTPVP